MAGGIKMRQFLKTLPFNLQIAAFKTSFVFVIVRRFTIAIIKLFKNMRRLFVKRQKQKKTKKKRF